VSLEKVDCSIYKVRRQALIMTTLAKLRDACNPDAADLKTAVCEAEAAADAAADDKDGNADDTTGLVVETAVVKDGRVGRTEEERISVAVFWWSDAR
jgi:hypothetical protein